MSLHLVSLFSPSLSQTYTHAHSLSSATQNLYTILYNFSLSKTGHLRQTTIKIIKEKISDMVSNATKRRTKSISQNHGDVGLQLDEDNALVASDNRFPSGPVVPKVTTNVSQLSGREPSRNRASTSSARGTSNDVA